MQLEQARFHHLALALLDEAPALKFLSILGYSFGQKVHEPLQRVYVRLCTAEGQPPIEIVMPAANSPIATILEKQPELIYHTCYEVPNTEAFIQQLTVEQLRPLCVSPSTPSGLFNGRSASFYYINGYGLIEFLETTPEPRR